MKKNISKVLKELRAAKGETQTEIANILGVTRQAYSRYESNLREPSLDILSKLADYYGVSPQIFFMEKIDSPLDQEMDIVKLSAVYQAKKLKMSDSEQKDTTQDKEEKNQKDSNELKQMKSLILDKLEISPSEIQENNAGKTGVYIDDSPEKPLYKSVKGIVFIVLILLAIINVGIMTIHSMDPNYEYPILDHSYINAITPGQNVSATMYTGIVKITPFSGADAEVGDLVVIYSDFGINEYWVEEITAIDNNTSKISVTYDNVTAKPVDFNDVLGNYEKGANIFGTIYYTSKFNIGFMLLIVSHLLVLGAYYVGVLQKRD